MKKSIVLMLALIGILTASYSQTTTTQTLGNTTFGIRAGINFQNLNGKDVDGDKLDNKMLVGFHVGANVEIPVAEEFYVQPGLLYSIKGAKSDGGGDLKTKISYLEIPINLLYKPVLGEGNLLLGFGPYFAFGVGGKLKGDNMDKDIKFKSEVSLSEAASDPYAKRFDAGANILVGYEFSNKVSAQLNAQLGLANIQPKITDLNNDKSKTRNTGFGVSIGYRF